MLVNTINCHNIFAIVDMLISYRLKYNIILESSTTKTKGIMKKEMLHLQYFLQHCSLGFLFSTNHSTPILVVLFLSFLLNIYICMYSYIDLTNSYNIFTIIDNLHGSLALLFSQYIGFACTFKYYMYIHNYTDTTNFYNIFIIIEVSIF